MNYAVNRSERFNWIKPQLDLSLNIKTALIKRWQYCNSVENFIMALSATVSFKKSNWLECHHHHYLHLKAIQNHFITRIFYYGSSLEIFESVPENFTLLKSLNSGIGGDWAEFIALAILESSNTSITEKCGDVMWNQQHF